MNSTQHDELAQMFAQNMHVSQMGPSQQQQQQQQPAPIFEHVPQQSEKTDQPVSFVSGHYTGMAHLRPDTTSEPSRSPPPPYHEALMPEDVMAETLRQNSIDPSALLPSQIQLFQNANYDQKLRLLELWRISPPSYPLEQHVQSQWSSTSLEQEEAEARSRYEQQQVQVQAAPRRREEHMLDTYIPTNGMMEEEPISPIREPGEAAWPPSARMRAASIASAKAQRSRPQTTYGEPEPYILNGYSGAPAQQQHQSLVQAVDPVYAAATGLWQAPSYAHAVQQHQGGMENQYGMYEQIRNHADWEAMNERLAREHFSGLHGPPQVGGMDDDMVM